MAKADALFQQEDHMLGMENNNKRIIIISLDKMGALMVHITDEGDHLIKCIKDATKTLFMTKKSIDGYEFLDIDTNGLIYMMDGWLYIPDEESLYLDTVRLHHDTPIADHPRTEKILELLWCSYSWLKVADYVKDYISYCDRCQYFKVENIPPACKLQPLEVPHMSWMDVTADFTTNFPLSNGFDSILVIVDQFSKEVEFIPCHKTITTLEMAKLYLHHIWKDHRLPRSILSDCRPQFTSQVMKDLCTQLDIKPKLFMAHHPQMNEQTKCMNQDLQQYLQLFTTECQHKWIDWLLLAQFFYNTKQQASIKKSPFEVICSYTPQMDIKSHILKAPAADRLADKIAKTLEETKNSLEKAQSCMKTQADKKCSEVLAYAIGNLVWLSTDNLCLPCTSKKLSEHWLHPYKITKTVSLNAVKLLLPKSIHIHPVINISWIKPYKESLLLRIMVSISNILFLTIILDLV